MPAWRAPRRSALGLRAYLLLLVTIGMLPAFGLMFWAEHRHAQSARADFQRQSTHAATLLATSLDSALARELANLTALANTIRFGQPDGTAWRPDTLGALLSQAAQSSGAAIFLREANGTPLLASTADIPALAVDPTWNTLVAASISSGAGAICNVVRANNTAMLVIPIVAPILRPNAAPLMLEMLLPVDALITLLRDVELDNAGLPASDLAELLDARQVVVAASRNVGRLTGLPYQASPNLASTSVKLRSVPDWQVVYQALDPLAARSVLWGLGANGLAALGAGLFAVALALLASRYVARWLQELIALTGSVAVVGREAARQSSMMPVAELEALRQTMLRAGAVLRRRAAAERMALREARTGHELLVSIVNGTAESIHVKDLDLHYVMVNRAALTNPGNNGGPPKAEWQVLGRQTADLFPPLLARRIEAADRRVLATGQMTSFEQEYTRPGESQSRWLAMTAAPWQNAEGQVVGVVSVSRDITQKRRAELRLRKLQAELLRVTRLSSMGAMASGLAHELNQPLAAATNFLNAGSRLLDRSTAGDESALLAAKGAVSDAAQQMLRAGAIVRRLRDFVERGEVELQPENVAELLRETCDLATTDGHTEGIVLKCQADDDLGCTLVDRTQIGQVLFNLIRNAAEAIQGMRLEPGQLPSRFTDPLGQITVSALIGADQTIWIEVADTGPGLAPGIADRLFQPFVSTKRTGMGIGLAICRTIVEGHGGTLTALPNLGGGMVFRISLPALLPQGVAA